MGIRRWNAGSGSKVWLINLLVAAFIALMPSPVAAQGVVTQPYWTHPVPSGIADVLLSDLDGDDQIEIILRTNDHEVQVLDTLGKLRWSYPLRDEIATWQVADLEGDGPQELIIPLAFQPRIVVLSAQGQDKAGWPLPTGGQMRDLTLADLDGDGRQELIFAMASTGPDVISIADSQAKIRQTWPYVEGESVHQLRISDLQGDGAPEIVFVSVGGPLHVFTPEGQEDPGWSWPVDEMEPELHLHDLDGDGTVELIFVATWEGQIHVFDANGQARSGWPFLFNGEDTVVTFTDLDNNQVDEMLVISNWDDQVSVLDVAGQIVPGWPFEEVSFNLVASVADLDDDGDQEIVLTGGFNQVYLLNNKGEIQPGWPIELLPDSASQFVRVADLDDDGQAEILAVQGDAFKEVPIVPVFDLNGRHQLTYYTEDQPTDLRLADLNGDGRLELLFITADSLQLFGYPTAHTRPHMRWSTGQEVTEVTVQRIVVTDLEKDNHHEVLGAAWDERVFLLDELGRLRPGWPLEIGAWVYEIAASDVDGDGYADIVFAAHNGVVSVVDGTGKPKPGWPFEDEDAMLALQLADLDDDRQPEIIAGDITGQVYALDADGAILPGWPYQAADRVEALAVGQEGEAEPLIAVGTGDYEEGPGYVEVITTDGQLLWTAETARTVIAMAVGDLDGDKRLEISAGDLSGKLYLFDATGELLSGWPRAAQGAINNLRITALEDDVPPQLLAITEAGETLAFSLMDGLKWSQQAQDAVEALSVTDLDRDGEFEVVVASRDGNITTYTADGEPKPGWSLSLGGLFTALATGDLDGDGFPEVIAAADDTVHAVGLVRNQPPLLGQLHLQVDPAGLALPVFNVADVRYIFEAEVLEPDKDHVLATLEVLDPASGEWKQIGTSHELQPRWSVQPFGLRAWNKGSAYRMSVADSSSPISIVPGSERLEAIPLPFGYLTNSLIALLSVSLLSMIAYAGYRRYFRRYGYRDVQVTLTSGAAPGTHGVQLETHRGPRFPGYEQSLDANLIRDPLVYLHQDQANEAILRFLGDSLYRVLFTPEAAAYLREHGGLGRKGVRLRLRFENTLDLAALPWEFLHGGDKLGFLSVQSDVALVRDLSPKEADETLRTRPPLKLLVAWATPQDLPPLEVTEEVAAIEVAFAALGRKRWSVVQVLEHARPETFVQTIQEGYDLLHFVGHGGLQDGLGVLYFEDEDGDAVSMAQAEMVTLLREIPTLTDKTPKLVVLNACRTAESGDNEGLAGLAAALVTEGRLPAVVGMGYPITSESAAIFSRAFYETLVHHGQVDHAVAKGREALLAEVGAGRRDWGVPRLYMRVSMGIVFEVV